MRIISLISHCVIVGAVFMLTVSNALAAEKWVACGDNQLIFYEMRDGTVKEVEHMYWPEVNVPAEFGDVRNMNGFVECKPVNNGEDLLVTSWHGGVARLNIRNKKVTFSAYVPHAHSAELLPGGRIIAVGNYLQVLDEKDGKKPLVEMRLDDGHGVAWNAERSILYVLSEDILEEFELQNWDSPSPALKSLRKTRLPGQSDGHDLFMSQEGLFLVSTKDGVWYFNPDNRQFSPHPDMNPLYRAQSIAEYGNTLAWVQAEQSWWGRAFFVKLKGRQPERVNTPDVRLYKIRRISSQH